ncbi:proline-rich protein 19 [Sebastes fasciatus]|uniref:proline-rich protein 19 n=1 Tax=Sebastes fasciatus TaxID=394691 RepID=UPI003D9E0757
MSHALGRASSDKQLKTTDRNCFSVNRFTADCKCLNHYSKTDRKHKMKRLRSRKERSQMRGGGKEASKTISHHHHHCRHQSSKDMTHVQNCCHYPSRRDTPFPNVIPAAQEPSIITDSRLIGHHGLFNHEVKSIDIERLLSEQRKVEKSGQQDKNNGTSHPSSTSHIPSPLSTNDLLGADTDEVLPFETKAAHDDSRKKEKEISKGSDITPGQRPQQLLDLSSESFKSISSSRHRSNVVIIKSKNTVMSEKGRESQLTPTVVRKNVKTLNRKVKAHMISALEHTPTKQESPVHQTQAHGLSPSPIQLSSSHTADSFDKRHRRQDPGCVSKSVSAVAAGLCGCLQFPLLRRRNLVAESREVLLKALRQRHGPRLQENLLEVRRCLSFGADPAKKVQDQKPTVIDPDTYTTACQADTASQPCFDNQKTTSFRMMGSRHFNWKSRPQPHRNLEQTAEWLTSPVETSVSFLDDILRPTCAPQFCMEFEPPEGTTSDHLFSPNSCWGEKASASQPWEDSFNRLKSNKAMFDSFENSFMNHTRAVPERSSASQYGGSNIQPFFPYQTQLPDRRSAEPMLFPQEKDPFETDRYSFAPSFSAQIHHPFSFQSFSQFSHPSVCPPLRSHHTDMIHYPPSHMLERDPAAPLSSFLSPEHWSFPPMRLY